MPGYIECSNAQFLKNSFLISSDMGHAVSNHKLPAVQRPEKWLIRLRLSTRS